MANIYEFDCCHASFTSVKVGVNGKQLQQALKSVEYSEEIEQKDITDTNSNRPIGKLEPVWKGGSASIEFILAFSQELLNELGNGYMNKSFPMSIIITPKGGKTMQIEMPSCSVKKTGFSMSGTDAITEKIEFILHSPVVRDGKTAIEMK